MKFRMFNLLSASIIFHRDYHKLSQQIINKRVLLVAGTTYINCFIKDLESKKLDVVILGEFQNFVYSHPRLIIAFELVEQRVCILHLSYRKNKVKTRI